MITLYDVKSLQKWDYIQSSGPDVEPGKTWLDSTTGYDYLSSDASWERQHEDVDERIVKQIHNAITSVRVYCNNPFYVGRQDCKYELIGACFLDCREYRRYKHNISVFDKNVVFGSNQVTFQTKMEQPFMSGDCIEIKNSKRNNGIFYINSISGDTTLTVDIEVRSDMGAACIYLVDIPDDLEGAIASMVNWDIYKRKISDKQSESIGNYSYSNIDFRSLNGLDYPSSMVDVIDGYRLTDFIS